MRLFTHKKSSKHRNHFSAVKQSYTPKVSGSALGKSQGWSLGHVIDQRSVVESRASKGQAMDPVAKGPGEDLLVPCHLLPVPAEGPRHCHKVCPRVSGILLKLSTSHIAVLVLCLSFSFLFFFYPLGRTLYLNCHVPQSPSVPSHCLSAFLITHSAASGWISPHRPHAQ